MSRISSRLALLCFVTIALVACGDDNPTGPEPQPPELRPLTAPENLIYNIQVLYNDTVRTAAERRIEYEKLLAPPAGCDTCVAFLFDFQPSDEVSGTPDTWGRDQEIQANANIFQAHANGGIFELTLAIQSLPAQDINDPEKPGWKEIYATNVHLRLLTSPHDGFEMRHGQAQFRAYPAQGRWWIGEWIDLPSPRRRGPSFAVEPPTWGKIKAAYFR